MQTINITELENNIAAYLEQVQQGAEILIESNAEPFAKISPIDSAALEERKLVAAGILRVPESEELPIDFWDEDDGAEINLETLVAAVRAERDED